MDRKGHVFTEADISGGRRKRMSPDEIKQWCEQETDRYRVVAIDPNPDTPGDAKIIAEELTQKAINKIADTKVRVCVATMMQQLTAEQRAAVIASFRSNGNLLIPFKMV